MKPEKENLIRDLLDDDAGREVVLQTGARILRRRRHWRLARNGTALLALVATVMVLYLRPNKPHQTSAQGPKAVPKDSGAPEVRALSDDELLALFPDTPVVLASLPNGKKMLIFPRPGDDAKFITRL